MRGKWVINLARRILGKQVSLADGLGFVAARLRPKPTGIYFQGIRFDQADHTLWSLIADIFINQEYTPAGFEINPNDIVVDIGGHKGVFASFARSRTKNILLVLEPLPENFYRLNKLVEKHHWKNVDLKNLAISDTIGEIELFIGKTDSRNSIFAEDVVSSEELIDSIIVPSTTLERVIADLSVVDFLKMDCEGAEFSILLNADPETFGKINKIAMEYHSELFNPELNELIELLNQHYSVVLTKHLPGVPLGYIYARN